MAAYAWDCEACEHRTWLELPMERKKPDVVPCANCGSEETCRYWGRIGGGVKADGNSWDRPRRIACLPFDHPDHWVSSPEQAKRVLAENNLRLDPGDQSGVKVKTTDLAAEQMTDKGKKQVNDALRKSFFQQ